jgi:branched-chain amino acid transport system ATP-binding protein
MREQNHSTPLLRVENLHVAYGGIAAVKGISFEVQRGELVALIGANGAGKTTTMKALSGLQASQSGTIWYNGIDLKTQRAHQRIQHGMVMVPEGRGVFARMSVYENLLMGAHIRRYQANITHDIERLFETFPRLKERAQQLAGTLSGGEQQMVAMARALMGKPQLLLLDEPSMGLSPLMVEKIFEVIRDIAAQGMTILLVEQNAKLALEAAQRAYVMESGAITLSGSANTLLHDARVRSAYLGEENVGEEDFGEEDAGEEALNKAK